MKPEEFERGITIKNLVNNWDEEMKVVNIDDNGFVTVTGNIHSFHKTSVFANNCIKIKDINPKEIIEELYNNKQLKKSFQ